MPPVLIGKGFQKNSFYYQYNGFYYYKNRDLKNGTRSLRCIRWYRDKCRGRAVLSRNRLSLRISSEHTICGPDYDLWEIRKLREAILSRCATRDTTRAKAIVAQEGESYERRIRAYCSAKILRSAIRRARMKKFPRIPKDLSGLEQILTSHEFRHLSLSKQGDGFLFAGACGSAITHSRCLIFQSTKQRDIMATVTEVFADSTCDGRPAVPPSSQVFSITTLVNDQIIPLCVCLMERKSGHTYKILLQSIKTLNPLFHPRVIHTDFETAEYSAFMEVFDNVTVEGCLFHFSNVSWYYQLLLFCQFCGLVLVMFRNDVFQNVSSQARTLGLSRHIAASRICDSLVRSCLAIPLVPTNQLRDVLSEVMSRAVEENLETTLRPFFKYIYEEYIIKREHVLSVCGSENRTNNVSESWNNTLQQAMLVRRPNVFKFLSGLRNLEEQARQDYYDITEEGQDTTRGRKVSAISNDRRIMNWTLLLRRGQISMADFLRNASRTLERPYRRHCPRPPPQQ
ncbi:Protein CbxX, chromosomal [Frankliniella fusca]|uniref:Protein CbxX, chromosomal n=1 Tax=Frankliniella fusca TaxID=407009 RepID=A0AAE1LHQ2_9NEOP|nr:Protein CbxX, chromosomal [Frankliniella fusca]